MCLAAERMLEDQSLESFTTGHAGLLPIFLRNLVELVQRLRAALSDQSLKKLCHRITHANAARLCSSQRAQSGVSTLVTAIS